VIKNEGRNIPVSEKKGLLVCKKTRSFVEDYYRKERYGQFHSQLKRRTCMGEKKRGHRKSRGGKKKNCRNVFLDKT